MYFEVTEKFVISESAEAKNNCLSNFSEIFDWIIGLILTALIQ